MDVQSHQMFVGVAHIGGIIAIDADALGHKSGHVLKGQASGVLGMPTIDHKSQRRNAATVGKSQRHGFFEVDRRHQFTLAQIVDRGPAIPRRDPKRHALTGAAAIQPQNKARPLGRAAMHMRKNTQGAMIAMHPGQSAIDIVKARFPDQRPVAEDPQIVVGAVSEGQ